MKTCAVMFHQFYDDTRMPDLQALADNNISTTVYINRVEIGGGKIDAETKQKNIILRSSPNCGKDIGGKMVMIDSFIRRNDASEWIIFLHDKKSLHKATGDAWRQKLWSIVSGDFIQRGLRAIKSDVEIGMLGPESCRNIWGKNDTDTTNMICLVDKLSDKYNIEKTTFSYVTGTMFWVRADIIRSFFTTWNPLQIRGTLEKGNVFDDQQATLTHAWERLFARIVVSSGMKTFFI